MMRWLLARLGRAVAAAWLIASLVFISSRLLGGGPEQLALGDSSDLSRPAAGARSAATRQAAQQVVRHRLGLDMPVFYVTREAGPPVRWQWHGAANQYHRWVMALLHGNLGYSYRDGQAVGAMLWQAVAFSLPLAGSAAVVAVGLALGLGLYLAQAPGGRLRRLLLGLLAGWQVMPLFLLALSLLLLFANPDFLNILPGSGQPPANASGPTLAGYWLARSVLPLLSLVLAVLPELTLPLVAMLRHEVRAGYATTARAKGLTAAQVLRRHALPNALLPLLTTLADLLPTLVAGTVVVEVLFGLPGSGRLLAEAAAAHDYPVVVAAVLLSAAARLLGLVLTDILYFLADPRLRPSA
ncbi:ABC transporter permease subunit [Hymenobacter cheonanensis]|uniref:ABC transporter permease subunit n=1 Tax=Hymenobacter sp. CA2-7 TaxID=3063993 RepID=UPI002714437C|nr:ABC transporter permease subunit [Hymenobacter sp. CA2-7]MDO7885207.1 ABC transporter permease subunit [Hymenobacter sp. CA2-7]